jgi:hypothetical protein
MFLKLNMREFRKRKPLWARWNRAEESSVKQNNSQQQEENLNVWHDHDTFNLLKYTKSSEDSYLNNFYFTWIRFHFRHLTFKNRSSYT